MRLGHIFVDEYSGASMGHGMPASHNSAHKSARTARGCASVNGVVFEPTEGEGAGGRVRNKGVGGREPYEEGTRSDVA